MVWAAIYDDKLIGPYFFPATVTGESYLNMLGDFLIPELHEMGIIPSEVWFQQDGAPPHFTKFVRHWLDENFQNWIGRGAAFAWAARSPDLSPLDFFLWGYIKHLVYQEQPKDLEDLRARIKNAFSTITPEMLKKVHFDLLYRLHLCLAAEGEHIEHIK